MADTRLLHSFTQVLNVDEPGGLSDRSIIHAALINQVAGALEQLETWVGSLVLADRYDGYALWGGATVLAPLTASRGLYAVTHSGVQIVDGGGLAPLAAEVVLPDRTRQPIYPVPIDLHPLTEGATLPASPLASGAALFPFVHPLNFGNPDAWGLVEPYIDSVEERASLVRLRACCTLDYGDAPHAWPLAQGLLFGVLAVNLL